MGPDRARSDSRSGGGRSPAQARGHAQRQLLVGTINSIGVRRDAAAVDSLDRPLEGAGRRGCLGRGRRLGHIGNAAATKALRQSLANSAPPVRGAVAEGCILCAERLVRDGKNKEAAEIYDAVRRADVPKPRKLEATRGAILARKSDGIPLLIEQIKSPDKAMMQIAFMTARELPGTDVTNALAAEVGAHRRTARRCCYTRWLIAAMRPCFRRY